MFTSSLDEIKMDGDDFITDNQYQFEDTEKNVISAPDVDYLKTLYANCKALKTDEPQTALDNFKEVLALDKQNGDWGTKALKQMVKGRYNLTLEYYKQLLRYLKINIRHCYKNTDQILVDELMSNQETLLENDEQLLHHTLKMTQADLDMRVNSIFDDFYSFNQVQLIQSELTVTALKARNNQVFSNAAAKLANIYFDLGDFENVSKLFDYCQNEHRETDNCLLQIYVLEMHMCLKKNDLKRFQTENAQCLYDGVKREFRGRSNLRKQEYKKAAADFYEAFKNYSEFKSIRRVNCLKYLMLTNMLMKTDINLLYSPEFRKYKDNMDMFIMTKLLKLTRRNLQKTALNEFDNVVNVSNTPIMGDVFIHRIVKTYYLREIKLRNLSRSGSSSERTNEETMESFETPEETMDFVENKLKSFDNNNDDNLFDGPSPLCKRRKFEYDISQVSTSANVPVETNNSCETTINNDKNALKAKCIALPFLKSPKISTVDKQLCTYLKTIGEAEDMFIFYLYQPGENQGASATDIAAKGKEKKLDEIALLIIHAQFGALLFKTKQVGPSGSPASDAKPAINKDDDGFEEYWRQIRDYFQEFLSIDEVWQDLCQLNIAEGQSPNVDDIVNAITVDSISRSFLCSFERDTSNESTNVSTETATILTDNELKNTVSFSDWWHSFFANRQKNEMTPFVHSLILNRFELYGPQQVTEDSVRNRIAKFKHDTSIGKRLLDPENVDQFRQESRATSCWISGRCTALPLLVTTTKNEAEKVMYDYLKFVGRKFNEDMFIVHSYKHVGNRGVSMSTGAANIEDVAVSEIDFVVIHKRFGTMLFEVKMMGPSHYQKSENPMSNNKFIEKGDVQLSVRWEQIRNYLKQFFVSRKVWNHWVKFFENDQVQYSDVDDIVNAITCDTKRRSFLCLFEYKQQRNVANATVLSKDELKDRKSFLQWWNSFFHSPPENISTFVHLLMVNRIVMDHMLSLFYRNDTNLDAAAILIDKNEQKILDEKSVSHASDFKKTPLGPSLEQLKLCITKPNQLRIQGPAGTGKTIVLIQKVKNLVADICRNAQPIDPRFPATYPTILVLCYRNPLKVFLHKHLEKSKRQLMDFGMKLSIMTISEFMHEFSVQYDEVYEEDDRKEFDTFIHVNLDAFISDYRIPHIFIDEMHNFPSQFVIFLYKNYFDGIGYFWMFYDPCQNLTFSDNVDDGSRDGDDNVSTATLPNIETFYLNQVYRCSYQQFILNEKFLNNVQCDDCATDRVIDTSSVPKLCRRCTPDCCVSISGPKPIGIACSERWLEYSDVPEDTTVSLIAFALRTAWQSRVPELKHTIKATKIFYKLRTKGRLQQTVVLFPDYQRARVVAKRMYRKYGIKAMCCAREFELTPERRSRYQDALRLDSYLRFQGLDATVIIIVDDSHKDLDSLWQNFDSLVFTRATCLTVFISVAERLEFLDFRGYETFHVQEENVTVNEESPNEND